MNEFKRHQQTSINVQKQANLIWNVADILRGLYKPHEYGKVILPMTVIKCIGLYCKMNILKHSSKSFLASRHSLIGYFLRF